MPASAIPFSGADVENAFPEFVVTPTSLGQGGSKIAFHAVADGVQVVIKILHEPFDGDVDDFDAAAVDERFVRELNGMNEIDCVNLVKVLSEPELREIGGANHVWYLEPFYSGGTLAQKLTHGPLTLEEVTDLARGLLSAISALWEPHRIVHRDIKPGNIVYDAQGEPVLLDLGIALYTTLSEITDSGLSSPRTDYYSSPEQFDARRSAAIDMRTDQFLIGMVLHEALTGEHPFRRMNQTAADYFWRLENYDSSVLDRVSAPTELKDMIARMLSATLSRRFRTIDEPIAIIEGIS